MTTRSSGGGSRLTGMTVTQALQTIEGNPTQEELFSALVTLAQTDQQAYAEALPRAASLLSEQSGQPVTEGQIASVVDELTTGSTGNAGLAGGPPPPPLDEEEGIPPIGVAPDTMVDLNIPGGFGDAGGGQIPAIYRAGDEWDPSRLSPVEVRKRQRELEKAGLLAPGSYTPGFWDKASADALFEAMGYANQRGSAVSVVLEEMASLRPAEREKVKQFVPPPEVKPDPAAIAQSVKRAFRSQLGRDPTNRELGEFAGYMTAQYGAAYDEQVALARAQFVNETTGLAPGRVELNIPRGFGDEGGGGFDVPGQSVQDVDPQARFQERLEARFGPEIDRLAALPEVRENMNNVFSSLRTMSSLVG